MTTTVTFDNLTREMVIAEPAGPRLNAWVARAKGMRPILRAYQPSLSWADAGPLLEEMKRKMDEPVLECGEMQDDWCIVIEAFSEMPDGTIENVRVFAPSAPLAIARAYVIARRGL